MNLESLKEHIWYPILGAVGGGGFGSFLVESLSTIILGALGAFGGWLFAEFALPPLKKWAKKVKARWSKS